jgi:preprotein translocase subunit YajC
VGNNSQVISLLYIVGLFAILYFLMIGHSSSARKNTRK